MRIPLWHDLRLSVWERQNPEAVKVTMPNTVLHTPIRRVLSMRGWMLLLIRYNWKKSGRYFQPATPAPNNGPDELTAAEARNLADDLSLQLYHAQDALAFVEECCVIADRKQRPITTSDVREWLKGARCGRQLAADSEATPSVVLRDPCPHCEDCRLVPRDQMPQHLREAHPETAPGVPS